MCMGKEYNYVVPRTFKKMDNINCGITLFTGADPVHICNFENKYLSITNASCLRFIYFFQAEDGIRDLIVTGVQTCALPIWEFSSSHMADQASRQASTHRRRRRRE